MESSALVAALLERDTAIVQKIPRGTQQVTSALALAEAGRADWSPDGGTGSSC